MQLRGAQGGEGGDGTGRGRGRGRKEEAVGRRERSESRGGGGKGSPRKVLLRCQQHQKRSRNTESAKAPRARVPAAAQLRRLLLTPDFFCAKMSTLLAQDETEWTIPLLLAESARLQDTLPPLLSWPQLRELVNVWLVFSLHLSLPLATCAPAVPQEL